MAGRSYRELRRLVNEVIKNVGIPPIFSGDCECGPNAAAEGVSFGYAMSLAAIADLDEAGETAYAVGRVAALQSRAVGIRWSFAPVVDLNLHPGNPITNARCYGDDPERINICALSYLRGLQDHGVAATLKHFPGDGVDDRDQHVVTTINSLSAVEWENTYGKTFRAGIAAGCAAIMVGHIALANRSSRHRDTGLLLPSTADPRIQRELLREELGFEGVILSDAIGMGGMAGHFHSEAERVVANLASGSDMVLFPMDVEQAIDAVFVALDRGLLEEKHLLASARRILKLKERFGITDASFFPGDEEADAAFAVDHRCLARRLAERSITLVVDRNPTLPLTLEASRHILVFDLPNESSELASLAVVDGSEREPRLIPPFQDELEKLGCRVTWVVSLASFDHAKADATAVVYITRSRPLAGRNSIRLSYNAIQSIDIERIFSRFPCVVLSLGNPCLSWELPNLPCLICTYSGGEEAQRAAARAICGEIPFTGRLPIRIPEFLPLPDNSPTLGDHLVNLLSSSA